MGTGLRGVMLALAGACLLLIAACDRTPTAAVAPRQSGANSPADAVRLLTAHLRGNDFEAFARDAVPPELAPKLQAAWRAGRTRWPLDELPLADRLPSMLDSLSRPGAQGRLQTVFDRQFAKAGGELAASATTLGLFGANYVANEGDFSAVERDHYAQLIAAASAWAAKAPLSDGARAKPAIARLTAAARIADLRSEADFTRLGMRESLRRSGRFAAAVKAVLASYGLDLDADLGTLQATLQSQTGDTAKVRMRYQLGGTPIDTVVDVERRGGLGVTQEIADVPVAVAAVPATPAAPPAKDDGATARAPASA